jgi:hypothetical protein
MNVILKSEENNEINFVHLILEFKLIEMKNKLKRVVDSISREEEELHIMRILNDYKHRQTLVKNCFKYLYKNILKSNGYKPKTDFIDLIVILMRKYPQFIEIQFYGPLCIGQMIKGLQIEKSDTNLINKVIEVILTSMESFPNNKHLFNNALIILNNNYLLQNASFDINNIQLVMNSLINSNDMVMNENAVIICSTLVKMISSDEKSKLSLNTINNRTLLKIVERCLHSNTNYSHLIAKTLHLIFNLNSGSFREIETQILKKLVKVTQIVLALFPNHQRLSFSAISMLFLILTEYSDSVLQSISFNRCKCIQIVMQSMINSEWIDNDEDITDSFNNVCADIIRIILNYEKSNSSSKPIYVKTLLDIIGMSVEHNKTYNNLLEYCLNDISNESIETLLKEKVFDLYFLVLKVSLEIFAYFVFQY